MGFRVQGGLQGSGWFEGSGFSVVSQLRVVEGFMAWRGWGS